MWGCCCREAKAECDWLSDSFRASPALGFPFVEAATYPMLSSVILRFAGCCDTDDGEPGSPRSLYTQLNFLFAQVTQGVSPLHWWLCVSKCHQGYRSLNDKRRSNDERCAASDVTAREIQEERTRFGRGLTVGLSVEGKVSNYSLLITKVHS
jgi:hypothetical protein